MNGHCLATDDRTHDHTNDYTPKKFGKSPIWHQLDYPIQHIISQAVSLRGSVALGPWESQKLSPAALRKILMYDKELDNGIVKNYNSFRKQFLGM